MTKSKGDQGKRKRTALTREDLKRGLVTGGTVTLATLGCSSCNDNGAVDPPPPPLVCGDVQTGQGLHATATLSDSIITATIENWAAGNWSGGVPVVTDLDGLVLLDVMKEQWDVLTIRLQFASDTTSTGQFTLSGELDGPYGEKCAVTRRFTVTRSGPAVTIAENDLSLPLGERNRARIELVRQEGLQVLLRSAGASTDWKLVWSVTEGSLEQCQEGVLWTLPSTPGFYQVELLTDHGDKGFGMDTLPVEVSRG
jgi:hypothetical protein